MYCFKLILLYKGNTGQHSAYYANSFKHLVNLQMLMLFVTALPLRMLGMNEVLWLTGVIKFLTADWPVHTWLLTSHLVRWGRSWRNINHELRCSMCP